MAEKEEVCSRDLTEYSGEDDLNALVQSVAKTVGEEKLNEGELHYAVLRLRELIGGTKQSYASAWIAVVAVAGTFFAFLLLLPLQSSKWSRANPTTLGKVRLVLPRWPIPATMDQS